MLPSGATRVDVVCSPSGPSVHVRRAVMPWLEADVAVCTADLFRFGIQAVLVTELAPLVVSAMLRTDGIGMISTLFMGPVRIDWGRSWGTQTYRWGSIQLSAGPRLSMLVGIDASAADVEPFVGMRVFPGEHALAEIGISIRRNVVRVSVGGVLW